MAKNHTEQLREFKHWQKYIRLILLVIWDPIGIFGMEEAEDEYDSYALGVYGLLKRGATKEEIIDHLHQIETDQIGLFPPRDRMDIILAAEKLVWLGRDMQDSVTP
ncbi:MAG TPA: hypothetical protein VFW40_03445 [Capsulimonadaceae bacterium]|nr:hypothetical protein [Capsulimonadaceae bacterium]